MSNLMGNDISAEHLQQEGPPSADELTENGFQLSLDRDYRVIPSTKTCPMCEEIHPLEYFLRYPCCCMHSDHLCWSCMNKHSRDFCGECLTDIPQGNCRADVWLRARQAKELSPAMANDNKLCHLLGRAYVSGCGTFLDELQLMPIYERLKPPSMTLAMMNPPAVQLGVHFLTIAAEDGYIAAMLDLADVYCTTWPNDDFQRDKKKAEYWFQKAIGRGNTIHPLAISRYADFLKWEARGKEARKLYNFAAIHGHPRGQFEYAICLLEGIGKQQGSNDTVQPHQCTNDETEEAIQWLCKASKSGFYVPSCLRLAKLLIDISEKSYGTAEIAGRSPLPRALQILSLLQDQTHGKTQEAQHQADELLERYSLSGKCACCGLEGSDDYPLMECGRCGVTFYCSRVCQRKDFRDGHRYDCCVRKQVFDDHAITLSLPWICKLDAARLAKIPSLEGPRSKSLVQMVEDDTDEVYGDQELDYDEHILTQLMQRMRINLETFLAQSFKTMESADRSKDLSTQDQASRRSLLKETLKDRIEAFARFTNADEDFIKAMHKLRDLGNTAAHGSTDVSVPRLCQNECVEAVRNYRECKERYEVKASRRKQQGWLSTEKRDELGDEGSTKASNSEKEDSSAGIHAGNSLHNEDGLQTKSKARKRKKKKAKKKNHKN